MAVERRRLLYWALEDELKSRYGRFVSLLAEATRDPLPFLKARVSLCALCVRSR